jgi:demethylmenaquinone methyltransferase/2-methoxy-6-polyprenyl-1,4-benzoquinol methylase
MADTSRSDAEPPPPGAVGATTTPLAADGTLADGDTKRTAVRSMFDAIAPRYDLVNRIMTGRLDVRWRRRAVRDLQLAPGSLVVDLACGTGDFCRELDTRGLRPIGMDLSMGMLAAARTDAPLAQADALDLPLPDGSVDGVTCGFALRNLVAIPPFLDEVARVVRRGGRIALVEVAEPTNPLVRFGHGVYFGRIVPLVGRLLSDADAYRYLPRSVAYLPPPDELCRMLDDAGFTNVSRTALTLGAAQLLTATRN